MLLTAVSTDMDRDLYAELLKWKVSSRRKPLLLGGARQTGKTFLLHQFGQAEHGDVVYCNFEEDPALASFFDRDLDPGRALAEPTIYFGQQFDPAFLFRTSLLNLRQGGKVCNVPLYAVSQLGWLSASPGSDDPGAEV